MVGVIFSFIVLGYSISSGWIRLEELKNKLNNRKLYIFNLMIYVRVLKIFDLYEFRKYNICIIDMIDFWIILMFFFKIDI